MTVEADRLAGLILASATDFAIVSLDLDGKVMSWHLGAEKLLGWSADEVHGRYADFFFTPEDRAGGAPSAEMSVAREQGSATDERWHFRKDETRFWGSGLMMPLRDDGGIQIGYTKVMRDRTAERAAELRYGALTTALPGFLFVADQGGLVTETNELFRSYTGRDTAELGGERWAEALHEDDRAGTLDRWYQSVESGTPFHSRHRFRGQEGNYRTFACRALPEHDDLGRVVRWMGTCLDVDDEARARAAVERLNLALEHEVTQGSEDLAAAIEDLQVQIGDRIKAEDALRQAQKMEAVGQLTGGVAHDFNNLLTVIRGSADLLRKPGLAEEKRERYLAAIVDTADRAASLTKQLLAYARRQPLLPEVFDTIQRLDALQSLLGTTIGPRIGLTVQAGCEPCLVLADPNQFDTAILNMAVNARDAMDGTGRITITIEEVDEIPAIRTHAAEQGSFVRIAVADTGPGISAEDTSRVFEPFYTTKAVGKGTGLGLSQVHGFAKQSGGDIAISSVVGEGATFTLYLPKAPDETAAAPIVDSAPSGTTFNGNGCILVVEDNESVGQFAASLLEDLGYSTSWAHDAQSALSLIEEKGESFDAIFSDVVMPGMSGVELARLVRETRPSMPIILTSGYSHVLAEETDHGFELLQKPYSADKLAQVLGKALGRAMAQLS